MALILAAGMGKRMNSDSPKVVLPVAGRPMILHVIENLINTGIKRILIVVGHKKEEVIKLINFNDDVKIDFVEQYEQKGTGHAVLSAKEALNKYSGLLLVTNGDMPLLNAKTFKSLLETHIQEENQATVLSSVMENPMAYGRLVRDSGGNLLKIVEEKDADDETRKIKEVNSGTFVFKSPEIFDIIMQIGTDNKQNEYYLPDVISLLRNNGKSVGSYIMNNPDEAMGANSRDELQMLDEKLKVRIQ